MPSVLDDLRWHVLISATNTRSVIVIFIETGPAEITQFDIKLIIQQNILRLDVPMYKITLVQILNSQSTLVEKSKSQFLRQPVFDIYIEEQAAISGVFKQEIRYGAFLDRLIESNDVRVVESLVQVDFALEMQKIGFWDFFVVDLVN